MNEDRCCPLGSTESSTARGIGNLKGGNMKSFTQKNINWYNLTLIATWPGIKCPHLQAKHLRPRKIESLRGQAINWAWESDMRMQPVSMTLDMSLKNKI